MDWRWSKSNLNGRLDTFLITVSLSILYSTTITYLIDSKAVTTTKSIRNAHESLPSTDIVGLTNKVAHFKVTIHWRNFVTIFSLEENFNFWNCRPDKVQRGDANRAPLCDNRKKNWIRKEKKKKVKFALEVLATTFISFDRDCDILE